MKPIALALAFAAAFAAPASAQIHNHSDNGFGMDHAMLAASSPTDGAELDAAPQALILTFRHAVTLQSLSISDAQDRVAPAAWDAQRRAAVHSIPLPALARGTYWIAFIAVADGGETMPGVVHFTLR